MNKKLQAFAVLSALFLAGQAVLVGTAAAAPAEKSGKMSRYCAVGLKARTADYVPGVTRENENPDVKCFSSGGEAIEFASKGRISRAQVEKARNFDELVQVIEGSSAVSTAAQPVGNPLLGFHYDYTGFRGDYGVYYGANGDGCTRPGVTYGVGYVGDYWNDDFASGKSFSGCNHKVYEHAEYTGAQSEWWSSISSYGALNEQITSILYG